MKGLRHEGRVGEKERERERERESNLDSSFFNHDTHEYNPRFKRHDDETAYSICTSIIVYMHSYPPSIWKKSVPLS
jgi:hypothetical protein